MPMSEDGNRHSNILSAPAEHKQRVDNIDGSIIDHKDLFEKIILYVAHLDELRAQYPTFVERMTEFRKRCAAQSSQVELPESASDHWTRAHLPASALKGYLRGAALALNPLPYSHGSFIFSDTVALTSDWSVACSDMNNVFFTYHSIYHCLHNADDPQEVADDEQSPRGWSGSKSESADGKSRREAHSAD